MHLLTFKVSPTIYLPALPQSELQCWLSVQCLDVLLLQNKKKSGVEGLIEIENPNRISQKSKKVTELDVNAPKELSRRER